MVKPDGSTRTTTTKINGTDGQYLKLNSQNIEFADRRQLAPPESRSTKFLRERRDFVRESSILNLKTYVFRVPIDEKPYFEKEYSPELGIIPVRVVFHDVDGSETITEAISVEFADVADEIVTKPEGVPVVFTLMEQRISSAEAAGKLELADAIRSVVRDWRELNRASKQ